MVDIGLLLLGTRRRLLYSHVMAVRLVRVADLAVCGKGAAMAHRLIYSRRQIRDEK